MVEKGSKKQEEVKQVTDHYQAMVDFVTSYTQARRQGKVLVKYQELDKFQGRQGFQEQYSSPVTMGDLAASDWYIFGHVIREHTGQHVHQGGIPIFVTDGRGYSVVDGVKCEYKAGDMLVLPIKLGGCAHQHWNAEQDKPCYWLAFSFIPISIALANVIKQVVDHPDWADWVKKHQIKK